MFYKKQAATSALVVSLSLLQQAAGREARSESEVLEPGVVFDIQKLETNQASQLAAIECLELILRQIESLQSTQGVNLIRQGL
jgi:hypothetical protein